MKKYHLFLFLVLVLFVTPGLGKAATFSITLDKDPAAIGDTFSAVVKIDSEDAGVNAAQATISFSKDTLQVVSVDRSSSVFNFWLQDPAYDNAAGQITFIGGSTAGFVGRALQAVKINLKVIGSGPANLTFTDGAITASDGSGTNLLSSMKGAQFGVGVKAGETAPAPGAVPPSPAVPAPVQITRPAETATGLPGKPKIIVSLYPNQNLWSNISDNFLVSWVLTTDISAVSTAINKEPSFQPQASEGLFDNKYFKALDDGVWYLHVRFRNNIGWGQTTHYKISVDTAPPVPFMVRMDESTSTATINPTIRFGTSDQPSGIDYYRVKIDDADPVFTSSTVTVLTLPDQGPGDHVASVRAKDMAGNITEYALPFYIIPVEAPRIISVSKNTYIGEGQMQVSGATLPDNKIYLTIKGKGGDKFGGIEIAPDANGNWAVGVDLPTKRGSYYVEVVATDPKGAKSFPVRSDTFAVRDRPIFVWGGLEITSTMLIVFLILLLAIDFAAGYWYERTSREQRGRRALIAQRDISVIFGLLRKDVEKMLSDYNDEKITNQEAKEIEFYLKRMRDNLDKMKRYVSENVEEVKE